jgi:hypothetical protein
VKEGIADIVGNLERNLFIIFPVAIPPSIMVAGIFFRPLAITEPCTGY